MLDKVYSTYAEILQQMEVKYDDGACTYLSSSEHISGAKISNFPPLQCSYKRNRGGGDRA